MGEIISITVGDEHIARIDRWEDADLGTLHQRMVRLHAEVTEAIGTIEDEFVRRSVVQAEMPVFGLGRSARMASGHCGLAEPDVREQANQSIN